MVSLEKSALAMSVMDKFIEDKNMAPFARDLVMTVVKKGVIILEGLSLAFNSTNLPNDGLISTLKSPKLVNHIQ